MPERAKILAGLALFLALAALPFWYGAIFGKGPAARPALAKPAGKACVESLEFMRTRHMSLLNDWRDQVVRQGQTVYESSSTRQRHRMRLTGTCLGCHGDMAGFCGRCHDYSGVQPNCWNCHLDKATGAR